jgi:hypothetical protein
MPRYLLLPDAESRELGQLDQASPAELSATDFAMVQIGDEVKKITVQDLVDAVAGGNLDAFGRQRVSNPVTLFDSKQVYDNQPLIWSERTAGAGTAAVHNANQASVTLSADPSVVGNHIRQTRQRFNYQPGKSQLIYMTTRLGGIDPNVIKRLGLMDDENGLFCEVDGANGLGFGVRTFTSGAPVDTVTYDGSWSLLNSGDGTLPIIDTNDAQIIAMDFEWLGMGRVRFGLVIDGFTYWVHEVNTANTGTLVYMSTPVLPLRYEIDSDGGGAPGTADFDHVCTTVMSEGGQQFTGIERSISRGTSLTAAVVGTIYPLLGLRINPAFPNSVFDLTSFSVVTQTASAVYEVIAILNPTVVGLAPVWVPVPNSILEADATITAASTLTGGTIVSSTMGGTGGGSSAVATTRVPTLNQVPVGIQADGTVDELWLGVIARVGAPALWASSSWFEVN